MTVTATDFDAFVADVAGMRDEIGILSVFVGADPTVEARVRPQWAIEIEGDLHALRAGLRLQGRHQEWTAFDERLRELDELLKRMVDPAEFGRGRALFAAVARGDFHAISLQALLPTGASLGDVPHLVPLLAVDERRPVGVVIVGRNLLCAYDSRLGRLDELGSFDIEPIVADGPERKGPVAFNPARGQQTVAQRERYARHLEESHRHRLAGASGSVEQLARDRGWELAVLVGDPRGLGPLRSALGAAGVTVELVNRDLDGSTPAQVLAELRPVVASVCRRRDAELVRRIHDAAASGGKGAMGLRDVLPALEQGRVEEVVLDATRPVAGVVGPDGRLYPPGGDPVPGSRPEPHLADHVAVGALQSAAGVSVVHGDAGAALADADGVAALLRW